MATVIEWNRAAPTCSIPLELAVYCVNCKFCQLIGLPTRRCLPESY